MTTAIAIAFSVLLVLPMPADYDIHRTPPVRTTAEGHAFVAGSGPRVGRGPLRTYRVEVEPAAGVDVHWFTAVVEHTLSDPRGWTGARRMSLRRVSRRPDMRVVLATPKTVDRICARAGLRTVRRLSCWSWPFAALNVTRWNRGAKAFPGPVRMYRRYLINHEVGHGLGHGHRACPRRGARAPVMQQQTLATRPCRPNAWPTRDP